MGQNEDEIRLFAIILPVNVIVSLIFLYLAY